MSPRDDLWGVGRRLHGSTSVTKQIYYVLSQAGAQGLTLDEAVLKVSDKLPSGYVWRAYQASLASKKKGDGDKRRREVGGSLRPPTTADRSRATRYVVRRALQDMTKVTKGGERAAFRRPDGRFVVGLRVPRAMKGLEGKYDESGEITRKAVTTMELVRVVRPVLEVIKARRAARRNLPTWRGWRLRIQTADDFERAVRREVDKRWRDLESERRLRIINLEVEERMTRDRGEQSPAMRKRP